MGQVQISAQAVLPGTSQIFKVGRKQCLSDPTGRLLLPRFSSAAYLTTKVSSPIPLPKRVCSDNYPGIIHSSENTPYFPGCTVVPQTPGMHAAKRHLKRDKEVTSGDCEKGLNLTFESHVWLGVALSTKHLPNVLKVIGSFPNTRREMNERWELTQWSSCSVTRMLAQWLPVPSFASLSAISPHSLPHPLTVGSLPVTRQVCYIIFAQFSSNLHSTQ